VKYATATQALMGY